MDVACFLGLENAYAYADYEIQKLMSLDCFGKDTVGIQLAPSYVDRRD